jgi:hypothetical protein
VRALEAAVRRRIALDKLTPERLLAVRADDVVFLGHEATLAKRSAVAVPDRQTLNGRRKNRIRTS